MSISLKVCWEFHGVIIICAKIFQYMLGFKDVQGSRVFQYVSRSFKETKGRSNKRVIIRDFIFFKSGMLNTLIIGPNTCQVGLCAKC